MEFNYAEAHYHQGVQQRTLGNMHNRHFKLDDSHIHTHVLLLLENDLLLTQHCSQLNMTFINI